MALIEDIGPVLGLVAFGGLAVLALLYFQQARELRRLRDWAGRAPERAEAAARREAEASAEDAVEPELDPDSLAGRVGARLEALDRRLPLSLPVLAALLIVVGLGGAAIATGGFGVLGGGESASRQASGPKPPRQLTVSVLNATSDAGDPGVEGLAADVAKAIERKGYKIGEVGNSPTGFPKSVAMYAPGHQREAAQLAKSTPRVVGKVEVEKLSGSVKSFGKKANLVLVIGMSAPGAVAAPESLPTTTTPAPVPGVG